MCVARRLVRVCCTALAVAAVSHASATMQVPTFKGGTSTVAVFATVANAEGRLVPDLAGDVFTILDNGKPQALTVFANDFQPITVVMLLDRSGSMRANFTLVEQAAEHFVAAMLPTDKARIGSFSNGVQIDPLDFTSDHDKLLTILRTDLQPDGPTPLWNAVDLGITALLREQGRRVVLVFTDGVDSPGNLRGDNASLQEVMARAEAEDVMIYAIGLAGQNGPGSRVPSGGGGGGGFGRGRGGIGQGGSGGGPFGGPAQKPDAGLPKIAGATGGGYFELTSTDDLATTFSRVADELHHQYALGFTPPILDAKRHTLEVRVAGTGLTVRARKSYLAVNERAPAPAPVRAVSAEALEAALASIGPATHPRVIRTWIGQSRGERGRTKVTFVWEPAPKASGDRAAAVETPARVSIVASGPDDVAYFKGAVPEALASGVGETASRATFDADPGPLRLRLSIEGASSQLITSETRTMTVTDLTTPQIALGTPEVLRARTVRQYQQMKANPEATPVATRAFSRTDRLLVRVPAYGPDDRTQVVSVRLLNQSGYVMGELPVTPVGARHLQQADVPVAHLPPGEYLVQIKATGDGHTPSELVAFRLGN